MIRTVVRVLWLALGWLELVTFTLVMYALSFLPIGWRGEDRKSVV